MIEHRWLRSFLAVAEELHFSRAARRLHLAQPALTAQIRQLEAALGTPLLRRTNRVEGLTPAGEALLPEARELVGRAEGLGRKLQRAAAGEAGRLRLGLIPPAAIEPLAEAARAFALAEPAVQVSLRQDSQAALLGALRAGDLDLAICRPPESEPGLSSRRVLTEEQGLLLRADHPLAGAASIPLARLGGAVLLLLEGNAYFGQHLLSHAARHRVALRAQHAAVDFPSLHWMVRAGLGVAPCSLWLAPTLAAGLVARRLRPAPARLSLHACWRGEQPPAAAARWLQHVRRELERSDG
ncbi:MAG: LysR family transcriptional regulator [Verrucomicrobia bacterium]|nr:LysR family transcriptional regulator [Verrucomicrobiota bacterium]